MTITKRFSLFIGLALLISLLGSGCDKAPEPKGKVRKISLLQLGTHPVIDSVVAGFQQKAKALFGNDVQLTILNGNFDSMTLNTHARQMTSSDADLLVSVTTPATGTLVGVNRGYKPLVFSFVSNPKSVGYNGLGSLPNTTGLSDVVDYERTLKLIRAVLPKVTNIGYLITRSEENAQVVYEGFKEKASEYGFKLIVAGIGDERDVRDAAESLAPQVDIFLVGGDNILAKAINTLLTVAKSSSPPRPVFSCDEESIKSGAIAGYSVDYHTMGGRTAEICGLILGGADPNKMQVERFTANKLILNDGAAKTFNITFPADIRREAAEIIP
jgi:putative tryptophan/tyrosine transport system substrate-binding protein